MRALAALVLLASVGCGASRTGASGAGGNAGGPGTAGQGGSGGDGGSQSGVGGSGGDGVAGSSGGASGASSGGASGSAGSGGAPPTCSLTDSGPVTVTRDGQVVERLRIVADGVPAIDVVGHANVVIRDVEIRHSGAPGINVNASDDITIENVSVEYTAAPASGENPSSDHVNIALFGSARPTLTNLRLTRGSSGVYLIESADSHLSLIEGHDFRGPFPRGQVVQWDKSDRPLLEDFSVINPAGSWPEDNVNVYQSLDAVIRRGFIDGNNSPSGVGVIFDGGPSTGLVEDVDAVHMGNGCFSDYAGGPGVVFRRTRCRDNICEDQGRGVPLSNALMWSGNEAHTDLRIEASTYFASCNGNLVWPEQSFAVVELTEADFVLRTPIQADFCWE